MLPDRVSNPGPLSYESGVLPIALRGPAPTELPGLIECQMKWHFDDESELRSDFTNRNVQQGLLMMVKNISEQHNVTVSAQRDL